MATQDEYNVLAQTERELVRESQGLRSRIFQAEQQITALRFQGLPENDPALAAAEAGLTTLLGRRDSLPQDLLNARSARLNALSTLLSPLDTLKLQTIADYRTASRLYGTAALDSVDLHAAGLAA